MKPDLDEKDIQILDLLQHDGRMTNADLAKKIGLSPPSTLQRVRALERSGFIQGYFARLNPEKIGLDVMVLASVSLALHREKAIEQFRKAIQAIPEVVECYHVSGDYDYLIKILVPNIRSYEALIREKISKIESVRQITSSFVLAVPKQTYSFPLNHA